MKGDLVERMIRQSWHIDGTWDTVRPNGELMREGAEEITRLRAALTTIHAMSLEPSGHEPNARRQMGEIAMRALEGETNG